MNTIKNIAISASAGSGKTYSLTNRFIYLLHLDERPDRIIALTFTRTAAGEFFQNIIQKLSQAAESKEAAVELSKKIDIQADQARYNDLLSLIIRHMHRLNLQTLDSFFFRIVSAFSLELGLPGQPTLMDENTSMRMRDHARDHIVYKLSDADTEIQAFWQAFRQATYGQESRSIESTISDFIKDLYTHYLESPDLKKWGQIQSIWPDGCPWQNQGTINWELLADNWLANQPDGLSQSQSNDFETLADKVRGYPKNEKTNTLLDRAIEQLSDLSSGKVILQSGRGNNKYVTLEGDCLQALSAIIQAITWHHLHRALQNTQGIFGILQAYDQSYEELVRRPGRIAFSDLNHLLAPSGAESPMQKIDSENRTLLDFRLDGQYDHWLFDEFQDTSRSQWQVVENLIDEVVQDSSAERSLFYVGDTKQCLYLWRNSDDRLFNQVQKRYTNIEQETLSMSWRSAPAILDAINETFDDNALIGENFSAGAAARWQQAWQRHIPSEKTADLNGYACWIKVEKASHPTRNEKIVELLEKIQPIARGMSVGVLVRKNDHANEVAAYIRENSDLPVHTGSAIEPAKDNAAGAALLAMLRCAAHPSDKHAAGFLRCIDASTLGESLTTLTSELRQRLLNDSHESAVRWACDKIAEHLNKDDDRHRKRLQQLIVATRAFDQEDSRSIDSLYHYLLHSKGGEYTPGDAVIVETIHKSKGLEYDLVILINEDKSERNERRISPKINNDGKVEWLVEPIKKELMQADPQLSKLYKQNKSQNDFGNLCALYVGMTRAKRGLYMLSDFDRVSAGSTVHYLRDRLGSNANEEGVLWQTGDPDWAQSFCTKKSSESCEEPVMQKSSFEIAHPRLELVRPSFDKLARVTASTFFDLNESASEYGSAVHNAFEQVEWWGDTTLKSLKSSNRSESVIQCMNICFSDPVIRGLFTRTDKETVLWREKSFSLVQDDKLINGVFDRVHLHKSESGSYEQAIIIDFKTDRIHKDYTITQAAQKHRPQMLTYQSALCALTGIETSSIELHLIFTSIAKRFVL